MKLYQEYGVNPLGGCLPLLLQFPILIAMYAVIRARSRTPRPTPPNRPGSSAWRARTARFLRLLQGQPPSRRLSAVHRHHDAGRVTCTSSYEPPVLPRQSGKTVPVLNTERKPSGATLDCGDSLPDRIPYFVMLALMIGTTFYSSRQTQKASPASAQNQQTQIITKVMPLMFGVFGFAFPAGLVLYWTVSNAFQSGSRS